MALFALIEKSDRNNKPCWTYQNGHEGWEDVLVKKEASPHFQCIVPLQGLHYALHTSGESIFTSSDDGRSWPHENRNFSQVVVLVKDSVSNRLYGFSKHTAEMYEVSSACRNGGSWRFLRRYGVWAEQLDHTPTDREQRIGCRRLCQPSLQGVDQAISFFDDLVFDLENLLPLAALLLFELADFLLDLVLLFECGRLPSLPTADLDLFLRVFECLFGPAHHVLRPTLQLVAGLMEVLVVGFE